MRLKDRLVLGSTALFAGTMLLASWKRDGSDLEVKALRSLRRRKDSGFGTVMQGMKAIDRPLVTAGLMSSVAGVLALLGGKRVEALYALGGAAATMMLDLVVRWTVRRERPPHHNEPKGVRKVLHRYSFPSAHAGFYEVFLGFLVYLAHERLNPRASWFVTTVAVGLAGLVGLSRVFHNEHWPTDVIGGYLGGVIYLSTLISLYRRHKVLSDQHLEAWGNRSWGEPR